MKRAWIFRHVDCEGPGYLAEVLARHSIETELFAVDEQRPVPDSVNGALAVILMGGPMSVNGDEDWIRREMAMVRRAVGSGIPVLGHCLGGQLISRALGAPVSANPVKEIGWLPVEKAAGAPPGLGSVPAAFEAFHWHGETFALPAGATPLFSSRHCENQGYLLEKTMALQFHVEVTESMVGEWAERYAHEIAAPSDSVQTREQMHTDLHERVGKLNAVADVLYEYWLKQGGLI